MYIHPENQKMLWNVMSQNPHFLQIPTPEREKWFRSIIQQFYYKYADIVNDKTRLIELNRMTITFMTNELIPPSNTTHSPPPHSHSQTQPPPISFNITEKKQAGMQQNQLFEERQKEYEKMMGKPPLPDIQFTEKLVDAPMSNFNELVEQQKKEREQPIETPVSVMIQDLYKKYEELKTMVAELQRNGEPPKI